MATDVQRLITQISGVAKQAARDENQVVIGTVISRNRDGSLNVDLGNGGCTRMAPAANVKIGDKVTLGLEPAIGTTTNLPMEGGPLLPPTDLCPTDPRDIPLDKKTSTAASGAQKIASAGFAAWADRDDDQGNGTPSNCSTWFGYKNTAAVTTGNGGVLANYRREVVGLCPHTVLYTVGRAWLKFDLAANGLRARGVRSGRIRFSVVATPASIHGTSIVIVPGSAAFPMTVADMDAFNRSYNLGSFLILGGWATGANSYGLEVELDLVTLLASLGGTLPDPFIVCLMTAYDFSGTTPPQVGSLVDNQDRVDSFNFYVGSADGRPVLELDYAQL
jgi:hypothetical protein